MDAQGDDKDATFRYIDYYQSPSTKDLSFEQKKLSLLNDIVKKIN
jgi:hypothetical protein